MSAWVVALRWWRGETMGVEAGVEGEGSLLLVCVFCCCGVGNGSLESVCEGERAIRLNRY